MLPRKVLIIGSGPIVIGQAAEFDYAGVQACLALRGRGDRDRAGQLEPGHGHDRSGRGRDGGHRAADRRPPRAGHRQHRPDALLPTLGGQTGLNLAVGLDDAGVLDRYEVAVLGTPLAAVRAAEDRGGFRALVQSIGEPVPESAVVESVEAGLAFVGELDAPVVVRPAFTLGGGGGGFASGATEARDAIQRGLEASPIGQVLVERSLLGWQEIEFEVIRDAADTAIAICGMENLDPMGVHTGDSIVVAPIQTLPDVVVQRLRRSALSIARALKLEGGCNVQLAVSTRRVGLPGDRGQPARLALVRAGLEGDRLPDRPGRRPGGAREAAGRDAQPGHRRGIGRLRAGGGLRGRQAAALAVRQVPARRSGSRRPDEGHR